MREIILLSTLSPTDTLSAGCVGAPDMVLMVLNINKNHREKFSDLGYEEYCSCIIIHNNNDTVAP